MDGLSIKVILRNVKHYDMCEQCKKCELCLMSGLFVIECVDFEKTNIAKLWKEIRNEGHSI